MPTHTEAERAKRKFTRKKRTGKGKGAGPQSKIETDPSEPVVITTVRRKFTRKKKKKK